MRSPERSKSDQLAVALDATPLLGLRTGVGEFCMGALRALAARPELSVSAFAVSWRRRHELDAHLPAGVGGTQRAMPARPLHWSWSHASGPPIEWFIGPVDLVHGTNYVVPPSRHCARVVTVHDLTAVRFPGMCDAPSLAFPRLVRRAADAGAWVHTPSRFVAEEVVAELGVDPERVRAVHHGIPDRYEDDDAEDDDAPSQGAGSSSSAGVVDVLATLSGLMHFDVSRFVLAIGTVEPRKDYPLLVRAFDELADDLRDVVLVIAGGDGWGVGDLETALESLRHRERIVRLGYVPPRALRRFLLAAGVVAYPSVYEGFGFVPLESMAAGTPVVATAAGAIPEIAGQGALLVPPGDPAALAAALHTVLEDDSAREALVERGRRHASGFSWSACGAGLTDLYLAAVR